MSPTLDEIVQGYTALNEEMQVLFQECRELRATLEGRCPSDTKAKPSQPADIETSVEGRGGCISKKMEPCQASSPGACTNWLSVLLDHPDPARRKRAVEIQKANDIIDGMNNAALCPVSGNRASSKVHPGQAGGCPFSARKSKPSSPSAYTAMGKPPLDAGSGIGDPIAAELGPARSTSAAFSYRSGSMDSSTAVCPIRYLDNHSPEEIAEYFQKHKHEIPRSHQLCMRRYQTNTESMRRLDAKYGNLVSMVQGLGIKHKVMMPPKEEDEMETEPGGEDRVKEWNESVQKPDSPKEEPEEKGERESRFDRPLREVRVGESPSRPWGIPVPAEYQEQAEARERDAREREAREEAARQRRASMPERGGKCPMGGMREKPTGAPVASKPTRLQTDGAADNEPKVLPQHGKAEKRPQMIFTGPVFFGYSAEDAQMILQAYER